MTVNCLYRWVNRALVADLQSHPPKYFIDLNFIIFPVSVRWFSDEGLSHFEFEKYSMSGGLNPRSQQRVLPGHYALYQPGKKARYLCTCGLCTSSGILLLCCRRVCAHHVLSIPV